MNEPPQPPPKPERLVFHVGLAIGLSILGDSFLYGNLPIEAENLRIALPLVGILLSANRLVRLVSNTWASFLFEKLGPRKPFLMATLFAFLTTSLYGIGWGFWVFLLARIGWGIVWSALRQGGYQAVWTGTDSARGKLMGLLWGMIRLGSAFGVLLGGYLRDGWGYGTAIFIIAGITTLAIPVAAWIRWPAEAIRAPSKKQPFWQGWQEALRTTPGRRLLFAGSVHSGFEGVMIATASLFLARRLGPLDFLAEWGIRIGTIAGLLLALRWTSDILFAPGIGLLFDHLGRRKTLILLVLFLVISLGGVVSLSGPVIIPLLAFLFISSAGLNVVLSALANGFSMQVERPHIYMGVYATALDAGAAIGPLLAYFVGTWVGFGTLYVLAGAILLVSVLRYFGVSQEGIEKRDQKKEP
jgi:MFS family permease